MIQFLPVDLVLLQLSVVTLILVFLQDFVLVLILNSVVVVRLRVGDSIRSTTVACSNVLLYLPALVGQLPEMEPTDRDSAEQLLVLAAGEFVMVPNSQCRILR